MTLAQRMSAEKRAQRVVSLHQGHFGVAGVDSLVERIGVAIDAAEAAARADERVTAHNGAIEKVALMECTWCNNVGPPKRNAATGWWEHETYGICEANKFRNLKLPEVPPVEPSEGEPVKINEPTITRNAKGKIIAVSRRGPANLIEFEEEGT